MRWIWAANFSTTNSVSFVSSNAFKLQLAFTTVQPLATNGLNFALQVSTGLNGHVQVSTDLVDWVTLTNFVGTNATINFRDAAATNLNQPILSGGVAVISDRPKENALQKL